MVDTTEARWLLFIHQIPPHPGYLRVKIRRRLQQLGAVAIKQTVYALPRSEQAREDFEWLRAEIAAGGGEAFICSASFLAGVSDDEVEAMFRKNRREDYRRIVAEAAGMAAEMDRGPSSSAEIPAHLRTLRRRLAEVVQLDFFRADGRAEAEEALTRLEARLAQLPTGAVDLEGRSMTEVLSAYRGRTWVTRQGIFVDRTASAWLIRRFIDPKARFTFVPGRTHKPGRGEVRFDMFEAEFTHDGDRCTFEVLLDRFRLTDTALQAIAEIVHDLDLKEAKFGRPETAGVGATLEGIAEQYGEDDDRLAHASTLWDALYASFQKQAPSDERTAAGGRAKAGRVRKSVVVRVLAVAAVGLAATLATAQPPSEGPATTFNFDSDTAGATPAGFTFGRTGKGRDGRWVVQSEADAPSKPNVLAQVDSDPTDFRFPVAVAEAPVLRDVRLTVRCKPVSGKVDRACGLVWRYRDANNYYLARSNAAEDNVCLYFVRDGRRRTISCWKGPVATGAWHTLGIEARLDRFQVYFNGTRVIEKEDATFAQPGKVGVWTKADSVTYFDDFSVEALGP